MIKYILRRLFYSIFMVLGITIIIFVITNIVGDPVALLMDPEAPKEQYQMLSAEKTYLGKQLKWLMSHPPEGRSQQVLAHIKQTQEMNDRLRQVVLRQRRSDLQFWIWDDSYWGSPFGD